MAEQNARDAGGMADRIIAERHEHWRHYDPEGKMELALFRKLHSLVASIRRTGSEDLSVLDPVLRKLKNQATEFGGWYARAYLNTRQELTLEEMFDRDPAETLSMMNFRSYSYQTVYVALISVSMGRIMAGSNDAVHEKLRMRGFDYEKSMWPYRIMLEMQENMERGGRKYFEEHLARLDKADPGVVHELPDAEHLLKVRAPGRGLWHAPRELYELKQLHFSK